MQSSTFNIEIYCTITSVVKYREIFQVYNNKPYLGSQTAPFDFKGDMVHVGSVMFSIAALTGVIRQSVKTHGLWPMRLFFVIIQEVLKSCFP